MSRNKDYLPLANFNASDEEQSELQPLTMKARMTTFFDAWKDTFVVVALLVQAAAIFILVSRESCKCNAVEERSWVAMGQFLYCKIPILPVPALTVVNSSSTSGSRTRDQGLHNW